jgi:cardiolipin synthase
MIVVDDTFCSLGTTNFDIRSFTLNFEINAFMYGQEITSRCAEIFNKDLEKCVLVTENEYRNRGILTKIEEDIFRLMSPLL